MNILFIIGNGFDINLGMKTRYCDFYEYYKSIHSDDDAINKLKDTISSDYKNWSDLELALGKYTENIETLQQFDNIFDDIDEKLSEYLYKEELKIDYNKFDVDKLNKYLSAPESCLAQADINIIREYKNSWKNNNWIVNVITFNYTKTLEKIREDNQTMIGGHNKVHAINFKNIYHIHGYVDDRMVMGVNDISQISNSNFHSNIDVLDALVKIECNKANKHTIDDQCNKQILSSELICIFGSSLGDTDNYWWEQIGEQLKKGIKLIIYTRGEEVNPRASYKKARIEREIKKLFLGKTKLSQDEVVKFEKNVYVGVNTDMFNLNNINP